MTEHRHFTVAERVRRAMGEMTRSERKVARVLLGGYPAAGLATVSDLAQEAEVSGPTVVRFVTKLGFQGYGAFQDALRAEVTERFSSPATLYPRRAPAGPADDLLQAVLDGFVADLRGTFEALPATEFGTVVDILADRRRPVTCIGGRYSRILAEALQADLHHLRPNARFVPPETGRLAEALLDLGRRDVLVVADYRRYQRDVVDTAQAAAGQGATVILLTDPWLSPIAEMADHVLTFPVEGSSPLGSLVAGLALVETIVLGVMAVLGDAPRKRLERFDELQRGFVLDYWEERDDSAKGGDGDGEDASG